MIKTCRSCYSPKLKDVGSLGNQYLSEFNNGKKPNKYPLDLTLCADCTLLQLKESVPLHQLYTENYGYKSGINNMIREDLHDIVLEARKRYTLQGHDLVLDIGANDGTLLSFYPSYVRKVACEPIKKLAEQARKHANYIINDFWSYEAWKKVMPPIGKVKIITIISCFYDLEDPNKFIEDIIKVLDDKGIIVIQQNYLGTMLKNNAFDNIVHEHLEYYSLKSLEHLLERHNLEVFDVQLNNTNGGSFRTFIKFMPSIKQLRLREEEAKIDKWGTYFLFSLNIRSIKTKIRSFIKQEIKKGKRIYLYGASTRGNSLIQYLELDNELIIAAVERNPEKWGKKIASLDIPIISEEQARKEKPDYMLCLPWFFFFPEMREREDDYIQSGGTFIIPLPQPMIVNKEGNFML